MKAIAILPKIMLKDTLEVTALLSSTGGPLGLGTGEVTCGVVTLFEVVSATSVVGRSVGVGRSVVGLTSGSSSDGYGVKLGRTYVVVFPAGTDEQLEITVVVVVVALWGQIMVEEVIVFVTVSCLTASQNWVLSTVLQ